MTVRNARQEEIDNLRAESTLVRVINCHFMSLPDEDFVKYVRSDGYDKVLESISRDECLNENLRQGAGMMRSYLMQTETMPMKEQILTLGRDRTRLYRGVAPGYGPLQPCEAEYRGLEGQNARDLIASVAGAYRSGGMKVSPHAHERADYIGIMLGYLSSMLDLEARAMEDDDFEQAQRISSLIDEFETQHLDWISSFTRVAYPQAETDFYRGHILMLSGLADALAA